MSKNEIAKNVGAIIINWFSSWLENPGDKISARITDTGRKVIKAEKNNGADKYSATQYPNGTVVETKTTKPR